MISRKGQTGAGELETIPREAEIQLVGVTKEHADLAIKAFQTYGKGQGHPARLNCGDCFAYALAKATGYPLLFKGNDFIHIDIVAAV